MLRAVAGVRDEILKSCAAQDIDLAAITRVFTALTIVDKIVFVRFDATPENPIWGEFCRWGRRPSVYSPMETIVEVRYASHLDVKWRRFVVCKELCHSLDVAEGCHDASSGAIDNIVQSFSLRSHQRLGNYAFQPFQSEILAEAGALELLWPLSVRNEMIAAGPVDTDAVATTFLIPSSLSDSAFIKSLTY